MSKIKIDNLLQHICFRGRMIDYIGVGLNMLLSQSPGALSIVHCATGRPFCYIVDKKNGGIVPSISFSKSLENSITCLDLWRYISIEKIKIDSVSLEEYSEKLRSMLNCGSVLIGPFRGAHFENELINIYRPVQNHCVLCVAFAKGVTQLIHPDGLITSMRIESLLKLHKKDRLNEITFLASKKSCVNIISSKSINRVLHHNFCRLKKYKHNELFSSCLNDFAFYLNETQLKSSEALMYRLGMYDLSLSLLHVNELVQIYIQNSGNETIQTSELNYLGEIVISLITILSNLLSEEHSKWATCESNLFHFSEEWGLFESCAIKLCEKVSC